MKSKTEHFGFLCLDKPGGMTSHDVVAKARRRLGVKQIGHAGTLDPMATGVMVLAIGKATRLLRFLRDDKTYEAKILLGRSTDTDDIEGALLEEAPLPDNLSREGAEAQLNAFRGKIEQLPPLYSAIHVNGERLYDLARTGKVSPDELSQYVKKRSVEIFELKLVNWEPPYLDVMVHCSAGTYIRSIARDLGQALGSGACLAALRRTGSGNFPIDACLELESFIKNKESPPLLDVKEHLGLPRIVLEEEASLRFRRGQKVELQVGPELATSETENLATPQDTANFALILDTRQEPLGVAAIEKALAETIFIKPEVVLVGQH
ncbi:MAG TPA: tRNA pseudouridine(55) synthase TruB [Candidatus Obscuribacter sp.]|nr:tRNA pseudouridine(55) synthase TruB [Candidatus Obscuribacter sp.]HMY54749.1 tRNA pseudouridine(55) synthase TruB [Candidatus Obscuribacter sp.]HND65863.1 tRNA pseudouridine(55) synthase TruB [Candidatus Obscuribacter sp.]HNG19372.1 tRNA pseudouridine(55) synthase TruB [Candidatus Obscuribacter sp.]HNG77282.1 tRNA pseudouridine(55) synthase TruB [Candidatus Obscuribacter sp.]